MHSTKCEHTISTRRKTTTCSRRMVPRVGHLRRFEGAVALRRFASACNTSSFPLHALALSLLAYIKSRGPSGHQLTLSSYHSLTHSLTPCDRLTTFVEEWSRVSRGNSTGWGTRPLQLRRYEACRMSSVVCVCLVGVEGLDCVGAFFWSRCTAVLSVFVGVRLFGVKTAVLALRSDCQTSK